MAYTKQNVPDNSSPGGDSIETAVLKNDDNVDDLFTALNAHDHSSGKGGTVAVANVTGAVAKADFNANTILAADTDDTPAALAIAEQTVVGRITSGNITGLTASQIRTLINVENGADVTDATNVNAAGAVMNSGNEAIAGVKTFSSFPVTPSTAPSTNYQVANKKYVDDISSSSVIAHKDTHDPNNGTDALDTGNAAEIVGVQAAGTGTSHSFARADHVHAINHGIADNHIVTIDSSSVADNDFAKFTANGLEGRSYAEVRSDLNVEDGATADQTAAEILTAIKTVDGAGSGLNADLLDGNEAAAFPLSNAGTITVATTAPASPATNDVWFDIS